MGQKQPVEFLHDSLGRLGTQHLALRPFMGFDLVDHQFDFPAFMIERDERQRRGQPGIEQSGHQTIDLAHFT